MSMQCRRCPDAIEPGQVANTIYNIIVCNNCLRPHERGYVEKPEAYKPKPPPAEGEFEMTPRRFELLEAADAGDVTKRAQEVRAYMRSTGKTLNSKGAVAVLKDAGLVYWEQIPGGRQERGAPTWRLRLTVDGDKLLKEALYTMKVR